MGSSEGIILMNGFYIILFISIVTLYYCFKYLMLPVSQKEKSIINKEKVKTWYKIGGYIKWGSIILCILATFILKLEIIYTSKLKGAEQAQADFGIFWVFTIYVIPTIFLVFVSILLHFKYDIKKLIFLKQLVNPFLICALLTILLPILLFFRVI